MQKINTKFEDERRMLINFFTLNQIKPRAAVMAATPALQRNMTKVPTVFKATTLKALLTRMTTA